jgi:hypothetical protein
MSAIRASQTPERPAPLLNDFRETRIGPGLATAAS